MHDRPGMMAGSHDVSRGSSPEEGRAGSDAGPDAGSDDGREDPADSPYADLWAAPPAAGQEPGGGASSGVSSGAVWRRLLVSDIDDTLVGDRAALAEFARWRRANPDCGFAIATGRRIEKAIEVLRAWDAPAPDILVTAVGSEIHVAQDPALTALRSDAGWTHRIGRNWPRREIVTVLDRVDGLEWQTPAEQRPHKLSFIMEDAARLPAVRAALGDAGHAANVIYSHNRYLDVLPPGASKGRAVRHLAARLRLGLADIITAGDSGNDVDMLRASGGAIVVGNAAPELAALRGSLDAYFAERPYAGGIVEGLDALW